LHGVSLDHAFAAIKLDFEGRRFFGAGWMGKLIRLQHGVLALALSRVQNAHVPWFCCPAAWLAVAGHRGWDVQVEVKHQCDIVCRPDA
jgi:hypothetical protein